MKGKSIIGKLMLIFFIVGVASLSTIGVYSYYKAKSALLQRTLDQLTSIRTMKKSQLEFFFDERIKNLGLISEAGPIRKEITRLEVLDRSRNEFPAIITGERDNSLRPDYFGFTELFFISPGGNIFIESDSGWVSCSEQGYIQQISLLSHRVDSAGNFAITDLFERFPGDTLPSCLVGTPAYDMYDRIAGVLAGEISVSAINSIMLENDPENGLGQSGEAYLVGPDMLMRSSSRFVRNSVMHTEVRTSSVRNALSNHVGSAMIDDYRTVPCLSSYSRVDVPGLNWVILAEIDYKEAMIPIISIRNDLILISLVISIFIFSIAQIISRTITQPVIRLKNAAVRIGQGDFNISLRSKSRDEIGVLSKSFEQMAEQLKEERDKRMTAMYDGQEMERKRISRELHDGLGQMLVALKMKIENTACLESGDNETISDDLRREFTQTIDEVRRVSYDLAPAGLYDFELDMAMKALCEEMQKDSHLEIEFSSYGNFTGLPDKTRNYLFRIAQEALSNAIRHSGAMKIEVHLMKGHDSLLLMAEDNGCGFEYSEKTGFSGNGLYNMNERARLLDGTFDLESNPGGGTTIRVKIPVKP